MNINGVSLLLVDDDPALRESLAEQLRGEGFSVAEAGTAAAGLKALAKDVCDLVILDKGLPDQDGRDLCVEIRRRGYGIPVIMLTGADSEADTVEGLEAGAGDYVTKPFRFHELLARIRAQLRAFSQSEDAVFRFSHFSFRPASKELTRTDGSAIRLTEKETAILKFLVKCGPDVVSRDKLLNEVWGYNTDVTTHTLETHVYRLRRKIEDDPANACLLVTESGGYRLVV